jgi:hypothetical protein
MGPGTAAVLVPPVFASADPARTAVDETQRVANLLDLLRWAAVDHRVEGLNPWHMDDWQEKRGEPQPSNRLGAFGCCLPRLSTVLTAIGQAIVNHSATHAPDHKRPQPHGVKSDDTAAAARTELTLPTKPRVTKKQLRWYMGAPVRLESLLFEPNPHHWLNTSLSLAAPAITGGGYQCCHGNMIMPDGTLSCGRVCPPPSARQVLKDN